MKTLGKIALVVKDNLVKQMITWAIFVTMILVAAAVTNKLIRSGVVASFAAVVISTIIFQSVVALQIGYIDKFLLIAVATSFPIGLLISGVEIFVLRKNGIGN